jgi:ribosome-associated protein
MRLNKLQKAAVAALDDIKARDIVVIDVRKRVSLYDTLIIASADSNRQVNALARHVCDCIKEAGGHVLGIEGDKTSDWVLVDCGGIIVHIMQPVVRSYYNLEELWAAPTVRTRGAAKTADRAAA